MKTKNHSSTNEYKWTENQLITKDVCFECGSYNQIDYHHVVPESKGGTRTIPLCIVCHGKVHGRNFVHYRELQRIGIEKAKSEGRYIGRRKGSYEGDLKFLSKDKNMYILLLLEDKMSYSKISKIVGVSTTTITKVSKIYKEFNEKEKIDLVKFRNELKEKEQVMDAKFKIENWMTEI